MRRLSEKYGPAAMALHWIVALLLSVALVVAWILPRKTAPGYEGLLDLHKSVGVTVLALVVLRLLWRLGNPVAPAAGLTSLEAWLSRVTHWALYAIMLLIPLTGYIFSSAEGQHLDLFGWLTLASPLPTDRSISLPMEFVHKTGQYAVYAVVGLHVAAALYHQFVKRDGVLQRMLPGRGAADD